MLSRDRSRVVFGDAENDGGNHDADCGKRKSRAGDPPDRESREEDYCAARERRCVPAGRGLRVGVQGGGCSGLSYAMRLDTQARDRDKIFEEFGARLFVDPKSLLYLSGTTLEYEETLMRQGFVFQNPNAARNCGCGSSFTA